MTWRLVLLVFCMFASAGLFSADMITLKTPGGSIRGEMVRITDSEAVLKDAGGKEQFVPLAFLKPREIYLCRKQLAPADSAQAHFELGEYCLKNNLADESALELAIAKRLDPKGFGAKADQLLKEQQSTAVANNKPPEKAVPTPEPKSEPPAPPANAAGGDEEKVRIRLPDGSVAEVAVGGEEGELVKVRGSDGKTYLIPRQFLPTKENVPARSPEAMTKFLNDQLAALKTNCSGNWARGEAPREWGMEESEHFYIFSNLKPELRLYFKHEVEALYKLLSEVLEYKEGDPLWNNKCPIYFISNREQFQRFAVNVDKSPSAANSGGYFSHRGRDVHIVIPLLARRPGELEKEQVRRATSTLRHEGTHAFLQLVGNDVRLNQWLHEGMAQFIEFWYDPQNNPDRQAVERILRVAASRDQLISWEEGRNRPDIRTGMDHEGYAFAWSRIIFLYNAFKNDKRKLPTMIKLIKDGKSEDDAMAQAFGYPVAKLEEVYRQFMQQQAKTNFKGL